MEQQWDYSVFWKESLNQIKGEISEQEYVMWFNNIAYHSSKEQEILVSVPSSFYKDQVKQRYLPLIEEKLSELSGYSLKLDFVIRKKEEGTSHSSAKHKSSDDKKKSNSSVSLSPTKEKSRTVKNHPQLRPEHTFTNFVIGTNNSFAANAAIAIAKNPGTAYNPCLIYGGVGLGKTHLIQSIGNYVYQEMDNVKISYVTSEQFTTEFIEAIREKKNAQFKSRYRNVDILLIDDIQFLQGKDSTQEELFHTFNALYDSNKQMVFTCDRPVSELKNLTDRLQNRFERGLNVDLTPPNFETRFAILKQKGESKNARISDPVLELICNNVTSNVRDLEAALLKLIAYSELLNKEITMEIAQQQLKDVFANPRQSNINIDVIQRVVADYFNLSHNDLRGKKRTKAIAFPRQIAMYIAREITEYSTTEVGYEFGGRDHTTVMHACQRIESRRNSDPTLEPTIQQLIRQIKEYGTKS